MIRVLLLLLLSGCSEVETNELIEPEITIQSVTYRPIENVGQVVYFDENCINPAVVSSLYFAFDGLNIYMKDHNSQDEVVSHYYQGNPFTCSMVVRYESLRPALINDYKPTMKYINGYLYTSLPKGYFYL